MAANMFSRLPEQFSLILIHNVFGIIKQIDEIISKITKFKGLYQK